MTMQPVGCRLSVDLRIRSGSGSQGAVAPGRVVEVLDVVGHGDGELAIGSQPVHATPRWGIHPGANEEVAGGRWHKVGPAEEREIWDRSRQIPAVRAAIDRVARMIGTVPIEARA